MGSAHACMIIYRATIITQKAFRNKVLQRYKAGAGQISRKCVSGERPRLTHAFPQNEKTVFLSILGKRTPVF